MKLKFQKILFLGIFFINAELFSDAYHNINGFFGERAAGLGGAFTAISDDPSGAFYNPAGLAYAYDNSISLSASNYSITKKNYENVIGPGQGYGRNSQNYIPNFFGVVRELDKARAAFSIVNPVNDSFQRNDQIQAPLYYSDIATLRNYNRETANIIHVGFSYAQPINSTLSWGASLYYTSDTSSVTFTQLTQNKDKTYESQTYNDNRKTTSLLPILGIMFTPSEKLSFGASLRRNIVMGGNRLVNTFNQGSSVANSDSITFLEGTHNSLSGIRGNAFFRGATPTGRTPENFELRTGVAYFPSKKLMAAFDVIYTSGYNYSQSNNTIFADSSRVIIDLEGSENLELKRYATRNYAIGFEYYLTDYLSTRLGFFTNNANTKPLTWTNSALAAANKTLGASEPIYNRDGVAVNYKLPSLRDDPRNEYINTKGISIGFSFSTAKASIGLNLVKEFGRGVSQIDTTRPLQSATYDSTAIYIVVSSRNN
jgi:hypothetical protein